MPVTANRSRAYTPGPFCITLGFFWFDILFYDPSQPPIEEIVVRNGDTIWFLQLVAPWRLACSGQGRGLGVSAGRTGA